MINVCVVSQLLENHIGFVKWRNANLFAFHCKSGEATNISFLVIHQICNQLGGLSLLSHHLPVSSKSCRIIHFLPLWAYYRLECSTPMGVDRLELSAEVDGYLLSNAFYYIIWHFHDRLQINLKKIKIDSDLSGRLNCQP